jgi:flagellar biosynthesis protein FlhA
VFVDAVSANAALLFGVEQTQQLLEFVAQTQPTLVRSLVPSPLSLPTLTLVLQRLLDERVSLKHAHVIFDCLATYAPRQQDIAKLAAAARASLQRQLSQELAPGNTLSVFQLDPQLTETLRDAFVSRAEKEQLALAPDLAEEMVLAINNALKDSLQPVLLLPDNARRAAQLLLKYEVPNARVIGVSDLGPDVVVTTLAWIGPETTPAQT